MHFYHIIKFNGPSLPEKQSKFFTDACDELGITYVCVDVDRTGPVDLMKIDVQPSDIVYRSAPGTKAQKIELHLALMCDNTIYNDKRSLQNGKGNSYTAMRLAGLPVVPALPFLPKTKKGMVEAVNYLGSFPLVIKVFGGYEGVGVIRVDSLESLNSVSDYIKKDTQSSISLMQYIPHKQYSRLVVVGDTVVTATIDEAPVGDFRGNAHGARENSGGAHEPTDEAVKLAVKAVSAMDLKCGGVDIMYADDGTLFLAEVNNPFNFAETQERTGVDVAKALIQEMIS